MIINPSKDKQFTVNLKLNGKTIKVVDEAKLLGTTITSNLKWDQKTSEIVRKAYSRMPLLAKISEFQPKIKDMITIYTAYIRSILEQSCEVWSFSITEEQSNENNFG